MSEKLHILIVGSGSVGKRHACNFFAMGCLISSMDPRADRLAELSSKIGVKGQFASLEDALTAASYDGAVICSPPSFHVEQSELFLSAGIPLLLEKPVGPDLSGARRLLDAERRSGVPVLLGYTWRWWPPIHRLRNLLEERIIGDIHHVRFIMSAHLADWHPWERYQDFFMADKGQGGGALLDESHWIDLSCWLFGEPESVSARVEKISALQIDSDDNVDMLMTYSGGLRVLLHLDLLGRPHEKSIVFIGEKGTLKWTADPNQIAIGSGVADWTLVENFDCERNDMFVGVAKEFLSVIRGCQASCTLQDGAQVLRIIEAARESSATGHVIQLSDFV